MKKILLLFLLASQMSWAQVPPKPYGPLPSPRQLQWHAVEQYGLIHFTPTTFENKEWGYGDADPAIFNPTDFDADQIVKAAKAGGLKAIILVAKHHDGFCLWPTKTTDYNITKSPFRGGKGDMVKEVADAARANGLKFGVYCSPWDRNSAAYGTPEYLEIYRAQLRELYTNYGELFMSWHDGANGGDGYYGGAKETRKIDNTTYYAWDSTWTNLTRKLQPSANIFSDIGWDVRWVGNEKGIAELPQYATFTPEPPKGVNKAVPGQAETEHNASGMKDGEFWIPAECDVPLRKGWFYHDNEKPKTPDELFTLYLNSVGRGAGLDLGLAPDTRGRLSDADAASLTAFGTRLEKTYAKNLAKMAYLRAVNVRGYNSIYGTKNLVDDNPDSYWTTDDDFKKSYFTAEFAEPAVFDLISLREYVKLGQRVEGFTLEAWQDGDWKQIHEGTTIGARTLVKLDAPVTTDKLRVRFTKTPEVVVLSEFGIYKIAD